MVSLITPTGRFGERDHVLEGHQELGNVAGPEHLTGLFEVSLCPVTEPSSPMGGVQTPMLLTRHHPLRIISSPFHRRRVSNLGFPCLPCNVFYWALNCTAALPARLLTTDKTVSSRVLIAREFDELNLEQISGQVGGVRIRQHVNPLKASLMAPVRIPKWDEAFADPSLPVMVDIGCGSGRFLMVLAKRNSGSCNYLGLEIREKLVSRSKIWAKELNLRNIYFMVANGTFAFDSILSSYPGKLTCVSILK
eukprot:c22237_g1_i1 orf=1220-1969(-)